MKNLQYLLSGGLVLFSSSFFAQIVYSDGALLNFKAGSIVHCNGGAHLNNSTVLTNDGDFTISKNSSLALAGTLFLGPNSVSSGNGDYRVEQDWINDGQFNGDNSRVHLYGNTEQFITSNTSVITVFNDLILTGSGTGVNRRKTLDNVNSAVGNNGKFTINDRELYTQGNNMYVYNTALNAVSNSTTFGQEGFVSSDVPGYLYRNTAANGIYLFPVGSSNGTLRYRPVEITPGTANPGENGCRLNNYLADVDGYNLAQKESTIDLANTNFYHSIVRSSGNNTADIAISYLPSADGNWDGIANWNNSGSQWSALNNISTGALGSYSQLQRSAWDFSLDQPYILTTPLEEITIPTAFTPNSDGVHDTWEIFNLDEAYPKNIVRIYNRWGGLLYEHDSSVDGPYNQNAWKGDYNGEPMPVASYYFIIEMNDPNERVESGTISILLEK